MSCPIAPRRFACMLAWVVVAWLPPSAVSAQNALPLLAHGASPRVGLVLGGGGARGAAHIGVLEVLERLHVPIACVAGTSMGALVAGAWAAGLSPAQMRAELAHADWADIFQDNPDYTELNFRNRRLSQRFLPGSEAGIRDGSAIGPSGMVSAQKIKLFFNRLVRDDAGERDLQDLPLPVSILATDIGTGERVVLREGSLTAAMRASMSVPGLMAPVDHETRKLVDGGLVDNLPVREVRERCKADVVIAVNVGSAPLKPSEVTGLLSVTAQMVALLTEQNVQATLATLTASDIYIKPDLEGITAADFERNAEAAERGRRAAEAQATRLAALGVGPSAWAQWRSRTAVRERAVPRIDEVQVEGLARANAEWYQNTQFNYTRAALDVRGALPWERYVLGGRAAWIGSPRGSLPYNEAARLGGFLNLTGFAPGQVVGDDVAYLQARGERIIGRLPMGLRGDMRLGVALESAHLGTLYATQQSKGWLHSLAVYLGGETPLGPVYVGLGRGTGGSVNAYLFVGTP